MKTYAVITSMDEAYYQKCGRACIQSFGAHWPKDIHLYVYDEGIIDPPKEKWVTMLPWSDLGDDFAEFMSRDNSGRTKTFAKKAFSIMAGMANIDVDRLIWLDADVITTYPLNDHLLDMITPDSVLSTHYGVKHDWPSDKDPGRISFSCETGFFVVNRRHKKFQKFIDRYRQYYMQGIGINLRRFYDGEVYGAVVSEFEQKGAEMLELNPGYRHKTPIPRSVMAPYIMHYKAGAKDPFDSSALLAKHNIPLNEDSSLPPISSEQE